MTDTRRSDDELRALLEKCTPLPWGLECEGGDLFFTCEADSAEYRGLLADAEGFSAENARLIVAAVNALPSLLDRLARPVSGEQALPSAREAWSDETLHDLFRAGLCAYENALVDGLSTGAALNARAKAMRAVLLSVLGAASRAASQEKAVDLGPHPDCSCKATGKPCPCRWSLDPKRIALDRAARINAADETLRKGLKLIEALLEPCSVVYHSKEHEWRKCRRCLAAAEFDADNQKNYAPLLRAVIGAGGRGAATQGPAWTCRCGDVFPSSELFQEHWRMVHENEGAADVEAGRREALEARLTDEVLIAAIEEAGPNQWDSGMWVYNVRAANCAAMRAILTAALSGAPHGDGQAGEDTPRPGEEPQKGNAT